jgi:hypothetical protein
MLRALVLLCVALLGFFGPTLALPSCVPTWTNHDEPGDIQILGVQPPQMDFFPPAVDLLNLTMWQVEEWLHFQFSLAAAPEFGSDWTYRYWIGFYVDDHKGEPQYMDLRIAGTNQYDSGTLISSTATGLLDLAEVPVHWNGRTATFAFPLELVQALYPHPISIGAPRAGSDGRSIGPIQGFVTGAVFIDHTPPNESFDDGCSGKPLEPAGDNAARKAPWPGLPLLLLASAIALIVRRNLQ